jgi:hypothetical protein
VNALLTVVACGALGAHRLRDPAIPPSSTPSTLTSDRIREGIVRHAVARQPLVANPLVSFGYPAMSKAVVSDDIGPCLPDAYSGHVGLAADFVT